MAENNFPIEEEKNNPSPAISLEPLTPTNESEPAHVDLHPEHRKRHRVRNAISILVGLIGIGMIAFGAYAYSLTKNEIVDKENQTNFFGQLHRIIDNDVEPLQGEQDDRINIALFGIGGEGHEGGQLTDTMMVASIKPSTHQVALISIPRDLQVAFYNEKDTKEQYPEYYKMNSALFRGGIDLAIDKVEEVTGLPMHYYVLVDFAGFRDLIDTVGGLDITIDTSFSDSQYPNYNYGYLPTLYFKAGPEQMNGERALQFSRSRHGTNGEGSDFSRARRQQKILEALREKMLSTSTLLNPATLSGILKDIGDHASTNAEIWEMVRFAKLAQDVDTSTIINQVISDGPGGLVYSDRVGAEGAYVLIPNAGLGDYSEIRAMAVDIFDLPSEAEKTAATEALNAEAAVVTIQNGSGITGLGSQKAEKLTSAGVTVTSVNNALVTSVSQTVVYDLTNGAKPSTVQALVDTLGLEVADVVRATLPDTNSSVRLATDINPSIINMTTLPAQIDIVVLLGKDQYSSNETSE
ncbi:MAG: LCP family protein [Candidatus Kerfeldbacteria bacterium]|nr:LCP family protein [Candidatus Kerfeldbacteria bacterium]